MLRWMVPLPPGWQWSYANERYVMRSSQGVITYRERCRPLRKITDVVADLLAKDTATRWDALPPVEALFTDEGEFAAFVRVTGTRDGASLELAVGVVYGDDFYSLLIASGANLWKVARDLLVADAHVLGVRRRRYVFTPPAGWAGIAVLMHAIYLAPEFPARAGTISIYPAVPRKSGSTPAADALFALQSNPIIQFTGEPVAGAFELQNPNGLSGRMQEFRDSTGRVRVVVVLEDLTYIYTMWLDTTSAHREADVELLRAIASSVKPLPSGTSKASSAFDAYAD